MDFKELLAELLKNIDISQEFIDENLTVCAEKNLGDFSLPCFKLAKQLRLNPVVIANESVKKLEQNKPEWLDEISAVNGYINFKINHGFAASTVLPCVKERGREWKAKESNGKTVCIDYSSVNIAKPFHIGHLLTTVIGGSLYRIFSFLGYKTVGINHLGDWGTQFGKLICAYLKWGEGKKADDLTMAELSKLYVRFHSEAEKDEKLNDEGRFWFKKIEDGDATALSIFESFKKITLREVDKIYKMLGITFDSYNGESFYNDKMQPIIDDLKAKGLLVESEGAQIVDLSEYGMPPCLILRSDGASLYATRDLAAAVYRHNTYDFDQCLYVVAYQQDLHFKQVFKVLELMGYDWAKRCKHVAFGMVSLENGGSLSTRTGNVVLLEDVLNTSIKQAYEIIDKKNPDLEAKEQTARDVGIGAVVFGALTNARIKDMVFSFEKALNFDGETAPYLQYTHARCCSLLSKIQYSGNNIDFSVLSDPYSFDVVMLLSAFDETVETAALKYEPSCISKYLIDLAQSFNRFYLNNRISGEESRISDARLFLTECVCNTLYNGLKLLLINAPERM